MEQNKGVQIPPSPTTLGDIDECTGAPKDERTWTVKRGKSKKILIRKTKRGGRRSAKYRGKGKNMKEKFSLLGNNCFGLKSKKESFYQTIKAFNFPICITRKKQNCEKWVQLSYMLPSIRENTTWFGGWAVNCN